MGGGAGMGAWGGGAGMGAWGVGLGWVHGGWGWDGCMRPDLIMLF